MSEASEIPARVEPQALVEISHLRTWFAVRGATKESDHLRAVDDVTLTIREGEILGLVGESGCGKSTLGKTLMGMERAAGGQVLFDGKDMLRLAARELRAMRHKMQYVYQDAGASLDPRWTIGRSLEEPLIIHTAMKRAERRARVMEAARSVGLQEMHLDRYPHELSGGQQRRVGLARILTLQPALVILDEPTAGLDVSVQATILKLILGLRADYRLTYLFISHDLSVVRTVCDRVAVMYLGRIVEMGRTETLFLTPRHPYTRALMAAVPQVGARRIITQPLLEGDPPNPRNLPSGCRFRTRCDRAQSKCAEIEPGLIEGEDGSAWACWFPVANEGGGHVDPAPSQNAPAPAFS